LPNEEARNNASYSWPGGKQAMVDILQQVQASAQFEVNGRI
jgi:hypothetical protein